MANHANDRGKLCVLKKGAICNLLNTQMVSGVLNCAAEAVKWLAEISYFFHSNVVQCTLIQQRTVNSQCQISKHSFQIAINALCLV